MAIRCSGHNSNGAPCGAWAVRGTAVCVAHGGAAPQVKKAAARRLAIAEAKRMVALAGVDMDPLEHLLDSLHRAYQLVLVWSTMVADLDDASADEMHDIRGSLNYTAAPFDSPNELHVTTNERLLGFNYKGEAQLHPFVTAHERALDRHAKIAKQCLDAGIDERRMRMTEAQVDLAQRAFEGMLEEMGLTHVQRQEARQAYARHLRLVPAAG